ncbi:MAG: IS66 family transposase [Shimia sp.]|nr:IS66 family transposase [Shimia sp.]
MLLKNHSLGQIDEPYMRSLSHEDLIKLSTKLLNDLKEAREQLNQGPSNSSRPPSSQAPWESGEEVEDEDEGEPSSSESLSDEQDSGSDEDEAQTPSGQAEDGVAASNTQEPAAKRKAGKPKGSPGYGRTQQVAITHTVDHRVDRCEICEREAHECAEQRAWTAYASLDIEVGEGEGLGLRVTNTKHIFYEMSCDCGHTSRQCAHRGEADGLWEGIGLSEWRLVGPMLCALIIALTYRARMSRARVQEFLRDWLGLELSVGTLQRCIEESARSAAPVEDQLVAEVLNSELLHADETPHKEHGQARWLWVFVSATTVLFYVGYRTKEIIDNLLGEVYGGWLMSDGYTAYRAMAKRLRCWAHLLRKAKGLEESLNREGRRFGKETTAFLKTLMKAIHRAREGPGEDLTPLFQEPLDQFRAACERARGSSHEKTHALAVEFLNDWEAIFRVLAHPHLPLTNNEAERALRHWVIQRRISYGTRTPQGSRAFALLASIIDTCRKRKASPWGYLAEVIDRARRGEEVPVLPAAG